MCYATAVGRMRIQPSEFWAMSPHAFLAALDGLREAERRADYRAGVIASTIAKAHGASLDPDAFFPAVRVPQSDADILTLFRQISLAHNARVRMHEA